MEAPVRSIKVIVTVEDHLGLYDDKQRARIEQTFPASTATLATVNAWTVRSVANAILDAQRSFPLSASEPDKTSDALDKPIAELTERDASAVGASFDDIPF